MSDRGYPQDVDEDAAFAALDARLDGFYDRGASSEVRRPPLSTGCRDVLNKFFSWTNGATIGTLFTIGKRGDLVGADENGNRYYQSRDNISYDGRKRRWVVYDGYAEASKVTPDWHGWLHYTFDEPPTVAPLKRQSWERDHKPNLTGTPLAWRPPGSLAAEGRRPAAIGDYEAWKPE